MTNGDHVVRRVCGANVVFPNLIVGKSDSDTVFCGMTELRWRNAGFIS